MLDLVLVHTNRKIDEFMAEKNFPPAVMKKCPHLGITDEV
jgi:hypothetical protein